MENKNIQNLRKILFIEGVSYLLLLFIAMPLKYYFDYPLAVKVVGMAHGILFIIFMAALLKVFIQNKIGFIYTFTIFIASLIPFASFVADRDLKKRLAPAS